MKMMKWLGITVLCGLSCLPGFGNLVKNADFSKLGPNGQPAGWECRGNAADLHFADGCAVLTEPAGSKTMMIQRIEGMQPEGEYLLSYEVDCPPGTTYFVYFESHDGKVYLPPVGTPAKGKGKWTFEALPVKVPAGTRFSRLVLRIMAPGVVKFRHLAIKTQEEALGNHGIRELVVKNAKDMLYNGNLERGARGWETGKNSSVVRTHENLGNFALKIDAGGIAGQSGIRFRNGREYRLTYFVKTAEANGKQAYRVFWKFPGNKTFGETRSAEPGAYRKHEITFRVPGKTGEVTGDLVCEGDGSILLDEFFLEEIVEKPLVMLTLLTPNQGNYIYATNPITKIRGKFTGENTVGKVEIILANEKNDVLFREKFATASGRFAIPATGLKEGRYRLRAIPENSSDARLAETEIPIIKLPRAPQEVVIREDGNFYVNGEFFFPLFVGGTYDGPNSQLAAYTFARNGVNGIYSLQGGDQERLDELQRLGMKLVLSFGNLFESLSRLPTEEFEPRFRQALDQALSPEVMAHPALFAYDISDEPLCRDIPLENLRRAHEILREKDPYHPLLYNESPRGVVGEYVSKFAAHADTIGLDIYPVIPGICHSSLANKTITSVGDYAHLYGSFVKWHKPVTIWLQAFGWFELEKVPGGRLPDAVENRFMNYDALVHGVSMITYFNGRNFNTAYYHDILFPVTRELAAMSGAWRLGKTLSNIAANVPLLAVGKTYDGHEYLIVLNRSPEPREGIITGVSRNGQWQLLGEQRSVEASGNRIKDNFAPYAVHIYSTATEFPAPLHAIPPENPQYETQAHNLFAPYFKQTPEFLGAFWIWYPGEERKGDSKVTAIRNFKIDGEIQSARLYATADNYSDVFLNDHKVTASRNWSRVAPNDITAMLKQNDNILRIEAQNDGGSCGLLAVLEITYRNGHKIRIVSDDSWKITNASGQTRQAFKIAPFGEGPWSYRLRIIDKPSK